MILFRNIFVIFTLFFVGFVFSGCSRIEGIQKNSAEVQFSEVCIRDTCYSVEMADTAEERAIGLMNRDILPNDHGMLFIFEQLGEYSFWMKNTLIPLDIIWISESFEIVEIEQDVPPCVTVQCESYGGSVPARYVLEVNAGEVERNGFVSGDLVQIK